MFKRPTEPGFYWVENDQEKFVVEVTNTNSAKGLTTTVTGETGYWFFDEFEMDFNIIRWLGKVEPPQKLP